jgi:hypothetical protein
VKIWATAGDSAVTRMKRFIGISRPCPGNHRSLSAAGKSKRPIMKDRDQAGNGNYARITGKGV